MNELKQSISDILEEYIKIQSFTNTANENMIDNFFDSQISDLDYFKKNEKHFGQYKIKNDSLNRSVNYAMIQGKSKNTIVLIHHCDIVNVDNYNEYKPYAFSPKALEEKYKVDKHYLDFATKKDLYSDQWMFGRGVADMKGGGAIQLALFKYYSKIELDPTIILMIVPDEENLSAGMRSGITLLEQLKEAYQLDYKLMINSEPHQRLNPDKPVISQGSISKINAFVYVQGTLAHAGKALEGLNPNGLLSRIVCKTDLSDEFIDVIDNEMSIPPTWILQRDMKKNYDISFPKTALGIMNILNFSTQPEIVLDKLRKICEIEMRDYISIINKKRKLFSKKTKRDWQDLEWETKVISFSEIKNRLGDHGFESNKKDIHELIDECLVKLNVNYPVIIIGFLPPYYPGVTNNNQKKILELVNDFSINNWNEEFDNRAFFTGISDLSYAMSQGEYHSKEKAMTNMIGWGDDYHISFESIRNISMPCVNIGPWGKDFHKSTERVFKEDLFLKTPVLIDYIIRKWRGYMFKNVIVKKPAKSLSEGITSAPELGKPIYEEALKQHEAYIEALKKCGVNVKVLEADERYPDSCFVEDVAVCTKKFAMVTSPGAPTRKGEEKEITSVLSDFYTNIEYIKAPGTLEGGDVMMVGDHYYIGLSERTNLEGANQLIESLKKYGMDGSVVEMKEMLHLKTGLAYLEDNILLVAGEFINDQRFEKFDKLIVDEDEAYGANCIRVNDYVLVPKGYVKIKEKIEKSGLNTLVVDTSEFRKVDGGLSCLSLRF